MPDPNQDQLEADFWSDMHFVEETHAAQRPETDDQNMRNNVLRLSRRLAELERRIAATKSKSQVCDFDFAEAERKLFGNNTCAAGDPTGEGMDYERRRAIKSAYFGDLYGTSKISHGRFLEMLDREDEEG